VELLKAAYPINWKQLLRKRLAIIGVTDPADLTLAQLAKFRDDVFRAAKQAGIKDPAAWTAHRAQLQANADVPKPPSPVEGCAPAIQPRSAEREPVAKSPVTALSCSASALRPLPRTALYGTTKAEVLGRAKAAVEAGAGPRVIAGMLACAQRDFGASQREIGSAIGRSASSVNRLLKWRRSAYKNPSPFGPTTRAGRAAHRSASAQQPKDDGTGGLVEHGLPLYQPTSLSALNDNIPSASAETEVLPGREAANGKLDGIEDEAAPAEACGHQPDNQELSGRHANSRRKLTPERIRTVIEALRENPFYERAAAKAGIHRKTLAGWLKSSEDGRDGYDVEWEGFDWRFHEACEVAIDEAHQKLLDAILIIAMGLLYKIDQRLVDLGQQRADVYARDENGDFIVEFRGTVNLKMLLFLLALWRPERYGKPKSKIAPRGGVLVVGEAAIRPKKNCAASIKARQWKAASKMVRETTG
jgi:hypothetical protein